MRGWTPKITMVLYTGIGMQSSDFSLSSIAKTPSLRFEGESRCSRSTRSSNSREKQVYHSDRQSWAFSCLFHLGSIYIRKDKGLLFHVVLVTHVDTDVSLLRRFLSGRRPLFGLFFLEELLYIFKFNLASLQAN